MAICRSCGESEASTGICARCAADEPGTSMQPIAGHPESADLAGAALVKAEIADPRTEGTEPAKGDEEAKEEEEEEEEEVNLRRMFSERLIRPSRLNPPSKLLIWLAIGQISLAAILMAVQKVSQPLVSSTVLDPVGGDFAVPLVVLVVMSVSVAAGYWFGLAGALRVRASVGVPVLALVTWTLTNYPITLLRAHSTRVGQFSTAGLLWAQLGVFGVLWAWLALVALARRRARDTKPAAPVNPDGKPWRLPVFLGAGGCMLAYYALEVAIWFQFARSGQTAAGTGFLLNGLGLQAVLLPNFLVLVLLLGSTDLLEWGEITVWPLVVRAGRAWPPWLLVIVTSVTAIAILVNAIRVDGSNVLLELAVIGIPAVLIAMLIWLAPDYGGWSDDIRSRAVTTGAVAIFGYTTILLSITSAVLGQLGWPSQFDYRLYFLVSTPVALAALTAGVLILVRGTLESEARGQGLLLVIVAVVLIIAGLPSFLAAARLPAVFPARHFGLLNGLLSVAAVGTLIGIISLAILGRLRAAGDLLANTLRLLIGLQLVQWLFDLLQGIATLGADSDYLLAGLFFLTVLWGFAAAGDKLTGAKANSADYPRDGRILLTVSYVLVSNATLLYLGALHGPARAAAPPSYLTSDPFTPFGVTVLGPALVIMSFLTRLTRLPAKAAAPAAESASWAAGLAERLRARVRRPSTGAVHFGVVVIGTALTMVSLALVAADGLPDLARDSAAQLQRTYTALVPGPDCDPGGATWFVARGQPVSTRCGRNGLLVTVAPHRTGDVTFLPPDGFKSTNYRISVTVTFGRPFDGCVSIFTRNSAAGRYNNNLCSDNSAGINALNTNKQSIVQLATGFARAALSYTIMTVSDGAHQSLFINGTKISAVVSDEFSATIVVGLVMYDFGARVESATFSHFTYTPLPGISHA